MGFSWAAAKASKRPGEWMEGLLGGAMNGVGGTKNPFMISYTPPKF